mmetsp:Transcript_42044/g.51208  ORF Transcript_42044/g.51208 Transcript_42044/m.51208 type:complete len:217 (-) Transcript_42044:389-1039(-)
MLHTRHTNFCHGCFHPPLILVNFKPVQHLPLSPTSPPQMPLLNQIKVRFTRRSHKSHRHTPLPRATRPTDPMRKIGRRTGQIIINHGRQTLHVQPPRRQIRRDQNPRLPPTKIPPPPLPRLLVQLPVQFRRKNTLPPQFLRHVFRRVPRRHEHEHTIPLRFVNERQQRLCAMFRKYANVPESDSIGECRGGHQTPTFRPRGHALVLQRQFPPRREP